MASGRFGRHRRLTTAADFRHVFDQPCKVSSRDVTLLSRPNGRPHARLGLAVPRRQIPKAVRRNRIKRLVRESFRRQGDRLAGLDIVVLVRAGADAMDNKAFSEQLEQLWQQLARRCAPPSSS